LLPSIKIETLSFCIRLNGIIYYKDLGLIKHVDSSREVSYRFTANRFDWSKWSNYYGENSSAGLIVPMK